MSLAKKPKMDDEEDLFVKYNVPVEIIKKIISFVPSKKNCFLISKTFHRESINATRKKCLLIMDRENIMTESFINVQWAFNEITWKGGGEYREPHVDLFIRRSKQIFEKFGPTIEKLDMSGIQISKSVLFEVLSLMPNLIDLRVDECFLILEPSQPTTILRLLKLKKISVRDFMSDPVASELLDNILCPSICALHLKTNGKLSLNFFRQHNHLKEISVQCALILFGISEQLYDDEQLFGQLCQLKLTTLSLDDCREAPKVDVLIKSQPLLTSLALALTDRHRIELVLGQIVKLRNLESLRIILWVEQFESVPEQLVHGMMRMPKLKKLDIDAHYDDAIKAILTAKNMQLESLTTPYAETLKEEFQQLPSTFPNLKSLKIRRFNGDLNCFARLKRLESLDVDIHEFPDNEMEVSESVCELKTCKCSLPRLIRMMPNIERLEIRDCLSGSFPKGISMKNFFDEVLSLKNLVELECDSKFLIHDEAINCINNRDETSKLERIIFCFEYRCWQPIVAAYEK